MGTHAGEEGHVMWEEGHVMVSGRYQWDQGGSWRRAPCSCRLSCLFFILNTLLLLSSSALPSTHLNAYSLDA